MRRNKNIFGKTLIGILVFTIAFVGFLEIGSRFYQCPVSKPIPRTLVCNSEYYPVNQEKIQEIQTIVELKKQELDPSSEDLDRAINLEKYENMWGLNGAACGNGMIFVRDNLGRQGRYFVARHELEHIFFRNGLNNGCSKGEEYCATMAAAKAYPVGFVETILSSLYIAFKESPTVWCFLFGSWMIFRVYILGIKP